MLHYDFDLLVIGGGSGGVRTSRWAAKLGARVAICEDRRYGGTCVIRGCIPKKLMLAASELPNQIKYFSSYGWAINKYQLNWLAQKTARDQELNRLEDIYENLLSNQKVTVLKGHGKITAPHTVVVDGQKYTAKYILIAVGGKPFIPSVPGSNLALTSDDMFELKELPTSLLVMGSGYIGLEFACIFNNFGSKVSLISRRDFVLTNFDGDVRQFLQEEIIKSGVNIINNNSVSRIEKQGKQLKVTTQDGKSRLVEQVLFATGRKPLIDSLGLESMNIKTNERGEIEVNKYYETSIKNIYALGDCANTPYQLTPVATAEGMCLANHLFADSPKTLNYSAIPTAVFTTPPVAVVGLTEEQAKKQYSIKVYISQFRPLKYTVTDIDKKNFMKLIVDKETEKVLGVHLVGDDAPEMIQGVAIALKTGAKKSDFDTTIGVHPTSAEEMVTMRQERQ